MFYVGLDVHLNYTTVCVLTETGQVHQRCTLQSILEVKEFLDSLPQPCEVCFEASTSYGFVYDLLSKVAQRVAVAHPGLLRLIFRSKQKNDRADAFKLAKLLYIGEVPSVYVPVSDIRSWRELITYRRKKVQKRTSAKNGVRTLLRTLGIKGLGAAKQWTKKGICWLRELELDSMHMTTLDQLIEEIELLSKHIKNVEKQLEDYAAENTSVQLLKTIPGVGIRTAEAVAAFIDNPQRFRSSKCIGAYFGLVPSQDQSGNKNRLGHITREGSATVRHLLTEAVWQATRRSPTIKNYMQRIMRNDPERRKIAIVATAHYMVRVMWALLKKNEGWKESTNAVAA